MGDTCRRTGRIVQVETKQHSNELSRGQQRRDQELVAGPLRVSLVA